MSLIALTCAECGANIEMSRLGASYCGQACRQKAYRRRKDQKVAWHEEFCAGCGHPMDWHNIQTLHNDQKQSDGNPADLDCSHINCDCGGFLEVPPSPRP